MVDLVTVEVIKGGLIYTAEEMGIALRNSSYSHNIKERMDHSCAIFDSDKRLIAQAEHIPVHLGSMGLAVKQGLSVFEGELQRGDMILFNDPYISGTHLPDITLIAPVFYRDEVIAYVANKAHHSDVGGKVPGSLAGDATELFQEGIIIPPVKFVKKGVFDREILEIIKFNVRVPDIRVGDLRAQAAANNVGINRILGLVEKYGLKNFKESTQKIMDYSERRMRNEIRKMPEGVYTAEDYLESTGVEEKIVKIKVRITINGSEINFDYTGTDPQVRGPLNAPLGVTMSGVYYTLMAVTDPTIPVNDGCYRPVELYVPRGCLMNPVKPAPVAGGNVETSQRNVDVLLKAFSKVIPGKVCAGSQGTMNNICVGGIDEENRPWAFYETLAGGMGGRPGLDGLDGVHVHMTNTMNTPIEALEKSYPLRFISYRLRDDSGGPGKWRGGCGVERSWKLISPTATLSILAERTKIPPWGLNGGEPGAKGEFYIVKRSGERVKLKSKCTVTIEKGDTFVARTPGGGGYGNPFERNPEKVLRDFLNGLVSKESARKHYGVVVRGNELDKEETMKLRQVKVLNP